MRSVFRFALVGLLGWLLSGAASAASASKEQIKGLDEQVQDIKTDVLGIAAELDRLEEKLLFPSGTQVSLFVSIPKGDKFRLDAVDIQLNGKDAAHHIYTFKELEALQKGGVQRIYTGNIPTGTHQIQVNLTGKSEGGSDYRQTATGSFTKGVGPKVVELRLAGPGHSPGIEIKE